MICSLTLRCLCWLHQSRESIGLVSRLELLMRIRLSVYIHRMSSVYTNIFVGTVFKKKQTCKLEWNSHAFHVSWAWTRLMGQPFAPNWSSHPIRSIATFPNTQVVESSNTPTWRRRPVAFNTPLVFRRCWVTRVTLIKLITYYKFYVFGFKLIQQTVS